MTDTLRDPVLLDDWHPVAISASLPAGTVVPVTLLDQPVALWRDSAGQAHAWEDRCPHRGTRLSLGCVQGDSLRCGYHGWTFNGEGRCIHIPALPALEPDKLKAQTVRYALRERHGLVWVCLGDPLARPEPPPLPESGYAALRKVWCGPYTVNSSGPRIVENFLDMAHFAFVHEGILGVEERAAVQDYIVEAFDDAEFGKGIWAKQCRAWQPQASKAASDGTMVDYTYRVTRPLTAVLTKQSGSGVREAISLNVQPLTETSCQVWIILALDDFASSDADLRQFQDTIFLQDLPILESQHPKKLPLIPGAEVSVVCDRMSLAYRAYLKQSGMRYGLLLPYADGAS
ncbi:aromatic ring-hydroxylating dioxygenase subunit alpha [Oxalobacteraceae bacterium]|nr:aromatic ring-hydroxylating dioxygenase subunit alpha [Oxalobacteraceae bacterium]